MPPNVLCIVLDAARADALEPYGARVGSSPAIATLAKSGAVFRNAYATATWTLPSHASMFTGLLPRQIGVGRAGMADNATRARIASVEDRWLPRVLNKAGYRTIGVSTNLWISKRTAFTTGFDEFEAIDSGRQAKIRGDDLRTRLRWLQEAVRAEVDDGAAEAERVLSEQLLGGTYDRPFFCFVNLTECHSPYLPPRAHNPLSWLRRLQAGEEARRYLTLASIWRACIGDLDVPQGALDRMRILYAASIRYMDDWLGRILERLEVAGLLDDTIVVVTSDHGENFGEGGLIGHARSLDDRLLKVPLIVGNAGALDSSPVTSLAHLPHILAELIGLDAVPWSRDELPDGVAVAQLDPAMSLDDPRTHEAAALWGLDKPSLDRLTKPLACATDGEYKMVVRNDQQWVYDLRDDRLEERPVTDLAQLPQKRLEALQAALNHPAVTCVADEEPDPLPDTSDGDEDVEDLEDRMRLLGYL